MVKDKFVVLYSIKIIFYFFIFFTLISSFLSYYNGYFTGELLTIKKTFTFDYLYYLFYYLLSVFIVYYLFYITKDIKMKTILHISCKAVDQYVHLIFLFLIFSLLITVSTTSVGTISREGNSSRIVELLYAMFQPVYLIVFYIYYYKDSKSRIYITNIWIFVASIPFTGLTGHIMFFIPFILSYLIKRIGMILTFVFVLCGLMILPFVRIVKFMVQKSLNISDVIEMYNFEFFISFVNIVIDRFNYVTNIMYIDINKDYLSTLYISHEYNPIFQGYIGSLFHKVIYGNSVKNINGSLNSFINGSDNSNATFPIISYLSLDIFFGLFTILLSLLLYFIFLYFIKLYTKNNIYFLYIFFIIVYLYLLQGWFWPFMNVLQALIIFTVFILIINLIKKTLITKRRIVT